MTTLTKPATAGTGTGARVRFGDLVAAEWIKLWSLRSTCWGLAVTALIVVGTNVNSAISDMNNWARYSPGIRDNFVPTWSIRTPSPTPPRWFSSSPPPASGRS